MMGYTLAMIASRKYHNIPDLVSTSTLTDHQFEMKHYDRNCTTGKNWFDFAGTRSAVSNLNHWMPSRVLTLYVQQLWRKNRWKPIFGNNRLFPPLGMLIGQMQSENTEPWISTTQCLNNIGLDIVVLILNSSVILKSCVTEGHNYTETHSTIGHAAAAASTAKSLGFPLIVEVPATPTQSEIHGYNRNQ